jgi:hypothetical protein
MSRYLLGTPVFLQPTLKIDQMDKKTLCIREGDSFHIATVRVEDADPQGINRGKCAVMVWNSTPDEPDDEPWVPVSSGLLPPISRTHYYERFLSQDAVDLIRPHNDPLLPESELLLVIPSEPESPAH